MTIYIKVFKKSNVYRKLYAIIFFIIQFFNTVLAQKTVAIHFYENTDSTLKENFLENSQSGIFQATSYKKYQIFSAELSTEYQKRFLIDLDTFYLKFSNEEEILDGQTYNIYINNSLLSYDEFTYFYNIVMSFPSFIDILNEYNYRLIFTIMNIFNFKHDKYFKRFIRLLWVSVVFNPIAMEKWYSKTSSRNEYEYSCCVSRIALVELLKLYKVGRETLEKIEDTSYLLNWTLSFKYDFMNVIDEYLYIEPSIIKEILNRSKKSKNFPELLDTFFGVHKFKNLFLYNISFKEEHACIFNLSFFKYNESLVLLFCSNLDILIQKTYQVFNSDCLNALNIIYSKFTIEDEISWLKTQNFKIINYVVDKWESIFQFSVTEPTSPGFDVLLNVVKEFFTKENNPNIFIHDKIVSCYDFCKTKDLQIYADQSIVEKYHNPSFPLQTYIFIQYSIVYLTLEFVIINFKALKNIYITFTDTDIKDFNIKDKEIIENIVNIQFDRSKVYFNFLSKILSFPSLENLKFFKSSIIFTNTKINLNENQKIECFIFENSSVSHQNIFVELINKMIGLKALDISFSKKILNPFISISEELNLHLDKLNYLKYHDSESLNYNLLNFSSFCCLSVFEFGSELSSNYPEGTLKEILLNKNFKCVLMLDINSVSVSERDGLALEKCKSLQYLKFSSGCKVSKISFFELFDSNSFYPLIELKLPNIEFTDKDLFFISKLKFLKKIFIKNLTIKTNVLYFLKTFSLFQEIEIYENFVCKKNIMEMFGTKFKHIKFRHQPLH
ncbi:hypothetical protein CWI39_0131p0030 [Hamiltosporidium magnivora]|uniref:Uncharacterized protein n=1 Tax=Hamiltosporidium magnivora TaxID=148818 RepID=A0A4Q9LKY7_9MICR|nr:hypothetical protein CWI39_0131p0030 [Hamiltosporidium magnivora]